MICSQCLILPCGECGFCHSCGKKMRWTSGDWSNPCQPISPKLAPRSQKIRGIAVLDQIQHVHSLVVQGWYRAVDGPDPTYHNFPTFARPCPIRPRHGFVDSRIVNDHEELKIVTAETLAADPDGEVLLCRPIHAEWSAVYTPGLVTVGKGNDGATAGKHTTNFPLGPINWHMPLKAAGIGKEEAPYVELVGEGYENTYVTQLRAGPPLHRAGNFVPHQIIVKEVLRVDPSLSLLDWEALMVSKKDTEGLVIYHPGGSPIDHFSVHARSFNIPIIFTKEPVEGLTLEPSGSTPLDPHAVLKGLVAGELVDLSTLHTDRWVNLMLHTLHHSPHHSGVDGWWLGFGAALMLRFGTVAMRGEARHIKRGKGMPARTAVYSRAFPHSLNQHHAALPRLINILRYGFGSGGIGGIKWAMCGEATARIFDAVGNLARHPTPEGVGELTRAFNLAVNQAHNGGWWMNKFANISLFDQVVKGSPSRMLQVLPFLPQAHHLLDEVGDELMERKITQWQRWKPMNLTPPRIISAKLIHIPGINGLQLSVQDRLLKSLHAPISLPINEILGKLPGLLKGRLFARLSPEGLELICEPPHEEAVILWKEKSIAQQRDS